MVAILENVTKYSPEAEETSGGSPRVSRHGLKMTPPPRPRAPEMSPPKNPSSTIAEIVFLLAFCRSFLLIYEKEFR